MYPNTPKMTPEQQKRLIELLETIGSGGKGCRSGPERYTLTHNGRKITDGGMWDEINKVHGVPAEYLASGVDNAGASHIPRLGEAQKRESNK